MELLDQEGLIRGSARVECMTPDQSEMNFEPGIFGAHSWLVQQLMRHLLGVWRSWLPRVKSVGHFNLVPFLSLTRLAWSFHEELIDMEISESCALTGQKIHCEFVTRRFGHDAATFLDLRPIRSGPRELAGITVPTKRTAMAFRGSCKTLSRPRFSSQDLSPKA